MKGKHILPAAEPARRRSTQARTPGSLESRRLWSPVIVGGINFKERGIVTPSDYARLDVDPSYQRGKTNEVAMLILALQRGGQIPDPVDLAMRTWGPQDGKLWIVDGFQRTCAFQELSLSFAANFYKSESLEAERRFFIAKNNRRSLSTNAQVKAWDGPSTALLHALNNSPDSSLYGRISFDHSGSDKLSASVLIRGVERCLSGSRNTSDIQRSLSRCDNLLKTQTDKLKATTYLRLVSLCFPHGYARLLPSLALAEVANEYWKTATMAPPGPGTIKRIAAVNWKTQLPGQGGQFQDLANAIIKRYWKG
jgi:hypothetical protein